MTPFNLLAITLLAALALAHPHPADPVDKAGSPVRMTTLLPPGPGIPSFMTSVDPSLETSVALPPGPGIPVSTGSSSDLPPSLRPPPASASDAEDADATPPPSASSFVTLTTASAAGTFVLPPAARTHGHHGPSSAWPTNTPSAAVQGRDEECESTTLGSPAASTTETFTTLASPAVRTTELSTTLGSPAVRTTDVSTTLAPPAVRTTEP